MASNILNNFEINANFWKINHQLIVPREFNELYKNDKSKDRSTSSKIMWAIALVNDPDSRFCNLPYSDRIKLVARDYLKEDKYDFQKVEKASNLYIQLILSPAKRMMLTWNRLMDEKIEHLNKMKYSDNPKQIEELLTSNSKLYSEYERIMEVLDKDEVSGKARGGVNESASEKGDI